MNCRATEPLLLVEQDGVLTAEQHTALAAHVAACPACRQLRADLASALASYRADVARVTVPSAAEEWQTLRGQLHGSTVRPAKRRPLAPVIWFAAPLAAAAAIALAFFAYEPARPPVNGTPATESARADFVEAADANASTMVFVDKESGWLVVWAAETEAPTSG